MASSDLTPRLRYEQLAQQADATLRESQQALGPLFVLRGLSLLATIGFFIATLIIGQWYVLLGAFAMAGLFLAIAIRHERLEGARRLAWVKGKHARAGLARLDRRWSDLPLRQVTVAPEREAYCKDLDLFGRGSLFQWLDTVETPRGIRCLRDWLLTPAEADEIQSRQAAVAELASCPEFGEELRIRGEALMASRRDEHGLEQFIAWADSEGGISRQLWMTWVARGVSIVLLLVLLLTGIGAIGKAIGGSIALLLIVANILFSVLFVGKVHDLFNSIAARQTEANTFRRLFAWAHAMPHQSQRLKELHDTLVEPPAAALPAIEQLGLVTAAANLRRSGLFGIVYIFLQFAFLWDFHWLALLENWRKRHGSHVALWFDAIAQLEALAALARAAHDEPNWCFPKLLGESDPARVSGTQLGHPLLSNRRVLNDVTLGPEGSLLLVTGSNMSGKSTLLRAIGTNVVLAQCGGKVCASHFELPRIELATSMRVHDSLAEGVSFYMAELKRLKQIVDQAASATRGARPRVCYLLDEILQGTNSRERHIAVTRVVAHLIASGAIGAVSTHDLELASASELSQHLRCVHFRESFEPCVDEKGTPSNRMTFDYVMREGVATTTNALKLLEIVGLSTPQETSSSDRK